MRIITNNWGLNVFEYLESIWQKWIVYLHFFLLFSFLYSYEVKTIVGCSVNLTLNDQLE